MSVREIGLSDLGNVEASSVGSGGPWTRIENHDDAILPLPQGTNRERAIFLQNIECIA